mgnify:CR=1 FL=1
MNFGQALEALKSGKRVTRKGWNRKGMWLMLVKSSSHETISETSAYGAVGLTCDVTINAHIDIMTATGSMQPGWIPAQADILAEDWEKIS